MSERPTQPAELISAPNPRDDLKRIAYPEAPRATGPTIEQPTITTSKVERELRYPHQIALGQNLTRLFITKAGAEFEIQTRAHDGNLKDFGNQRWTRVEIPNNEYIVGTTRTGEQSLVGREGKPVPTNRNGAIFPAESITVDGGRLTLRFSTAVWDRIQRDEFASTYYGSGLDSESRTYTIPLGTYHRNIGTA